MKIIIKVVKFLFAKAALKSIVLEVGIRFKRKSFQIKLYFSNIGTAS